MPSITAMMSTILQADALIAPMVSTTSATTAPPREAVLDADSARLLASTALSLFMRTIEVSSSIDDAVSSSAAACCSVRADKSWLPEAISLAAVAIVSVAPRTWPTMAVRLAFMSLSAASNRPVSFCAPISTVWVRSPAATRCASATACPSGPVMARTSVSPSTSASAMPHKVAPISSARTTTNVCCECSYCWLPASVMYLSSALMPALTGTISVISCPCTISVALNWSWARTAAMPGLRPSLINRVRAASKRSPSARSSALIGPLR